MANIQLYSDEQNGYYSPEQIVELDKPLDQRLVSQRKGGGGRALSYIEGHDAIDQANRLFGYGQWCYEPVTLDQVVLIDPVTGEAVGIEYKALVKLTVRGAIGPIVDVGSQPVATWSVEDQVMGRRINDAKYNKKPVDESPFTLLEKRNARAVIVEAHEQAKKGAVTDALKRCLRAYGNQFGNGLYGDGHVNLDEPANGTRVVEDRPRQLPAKSQAPATPLSQVPTQKALQQECEQMCGQNKWLATVSSILNRVYTGEELTPDECERVHQGLQVAATDQQTNSIQKLCQHLGKSEPNYTGMKFFAAKSLIVELTAEYKQLKGKAS